MPSKTPWRAWEKRAATQLKRGQWLLADIMAGLGESHADYDLATDIADAVVERCEELTDVLMRMRRADARSRNHKEPE